MRSTQQSSPARRTIASVIEQLQAERRWLTLMRLSFAFVCLAWLLLVAWAVPGTPIADSTPDSDAAMALGWVFALAAACSTTAFWMMWRPSFRGESFSEFIRVVLGGGQLVRGRGQFLARLRRACARRRDDGFSLIVISLPEVRGDARARPQTSKQLPSLASMLVRGIARNEDIVADAGDAVWVLARGVDQALQGPVIERFARALSDPGSPIGPPQACLIGVSTFGPDGEREQPLLSAARERLTPATELVTFAAAA